MSENLGVLGRDEDEINREIDAIAMNSMDLQNEQIKTLNTHL